ncbi:MAG TPA: hypothetical protein VMW38_26835 [Terriglobia bacterium]|nr:hypothetical protein [Terriglobia bacterium]
MNGQDRQQVLRDLVEIQSLAQKIRRNAGVPVLESCARWCETYSQIALWSMGEKERFGIMEAQQETTKAACAP